MTENGVGLITRMHRQQVERIWRNPPPDSPPRPRTIHYTQLKPDESNGLLSREWNYYLREVGRLLAEGHEGRARGYELFLLQAFLARQIREHEPLLNSLWVRLCRCSP